MTFYQNAQRQFAALAGALLFTVVLVSASAPAVSLT